MNLENRCITIDYNMSNISNIDYKKVNGIKEKLVKKSTTFIDKILK